MTEVQFIEISGATKAVIGGRLDTAGVSAIEIRFLSGIAASQAAAIVDLSKVSFVASLGIRMLLAAARSLRNRGANLAVFGARAEVMEILRTTALIDIIPALPSESEALATVTE